MFHFQQKLPGYHCDQMFVLFFLFLETGHEEENSFSQTNMLMTVFVTRVINIKRMSFLDLIYCNILQEFLDLRIHESY